MKKLIVLLLLLVVGVPAAVIVFGGQLLETGVEKGGTVALGSETTLHSATLSLLSGDVKLNDFKIRNPQGFTADHVFAVDQIAVSANTKSFLGDTIEINNIDIKAPAITLEFNQGGTNLGALMKHLEGSGGGSGGGGKPDGEASTGGGKKLRVGRITIEAARLNLVAAMLSKEATSITLPTLEVKDLGNDLTMAQLLEKVLAVIMTAAADSGLDAQLKGLLNGEVANLKAGVDKALKDAMGGATKQLDDAKKQAENALEKGLGGLLGGKQDDK